MYTNPSTALVVLWQRGKRNCLREVGVALRMLLFEYRQLSLTKDEIRNMDDSLKTVLFELLELLETWIDEIWHHGIKCVQSEDAVC